jgi:GTP-binding protein HflX
MLEVNEKPLRKKALLFAITRDSLSELEELLKTAGGSSIGQVTSRKDGRDPNYYFTEGKLGELSEATARLKPDFLLCNDPLSPREERNIEKEVGVPVLDRTALILDIFAIHAKTAEGKLQVEIAQIEYLMTRMRGLWSHLERLGAGVGTRGPGESQIETDRRLARKRLQVLRKRLKHLNESRQRGRKTRLASGVPRLALFGYTNAGKSTLQEVLTGKSAPSSDQLFHTLDAKTTSFVLQNNDYLVTDTVGLIAKLPHNLIAAFRATLSEVIDSDLVLHVVDARRQESEIPVGEEILCDLLGEKRDERRLLLFNKIDLLSEDEILNLQINYPDAVFLSGKTRRGITELQERIAREVTRDMEKIIYSFPDNNPYLPYHLERLAFRRNLKEENGHLVLEAFTPKSKSYLFATSPSLAKKEQTSKQR